jgi:hypothetical protein
MRVAYVRSGDRHDRAYLTRADGSTATIHPHAYAGGLPHDLAHFAVERALGIVEGFWGLLAGGVDWERVNAAANRGAKGVLGRDVRGLRLAEGAVGAVAGPAGAAGPAVDRADAEASVDDLVAAAYAGAGLPPPPDLADRVAQARADLADLAARWAAVPTGGQLLLDWPDQLSASTASSVRSPSAP